jgi:hypothetical protein
MIRVIIEDASEVTITRFMNGLNRDITHIMKLHHHMKLEEMMHMVMKVERQLKWKGTIKQS